MISDMPSSSSHSHIDPSIEKFPHCIVWTPLPGITWFLPFIGKRRSMMMMMMIVMMIEHLCLFVMRMF